MAEQQTIKYDPQWNNMTVENVIFQTNNVVELPRGVLEHCFTFDHFPSTDEPKKRPLKEFLIKFSVSNGKRPLTLDFKTFCSSTGLDYNNVKYVEHPTPEVIKMELGKITINPSYLDKTPVLKNSFPVAWRILFSFVIRVLGGNYSSAYDAIDNELPIPQQDLIASPTILPPSPVLSLSSMFDSRHFFPPGKILPPKDVEIPIESPISISPSSSVRSTSPIRLRQIPRELGIQSALPAPKQAPCTVPNPQDLERDIQLASTGLHSTLDEGTHKSKPSPEGTATHSKDSRGNKHPLNRDIPFVTPDEGTAKTTPRPKGSHEDNDSVGNKPLANMELKNLTDVDLSGTGAKYQEDHTQSSRLRYQSLTENEESEEDILGAGEEMDDNPQSDEIQHQSSPPHTKASDIDSSSDKILKKYDDTFPLTKQQLVKYLRKVSSSIDDYYNENIAHRDQTNKLVEASMSSLKKSNTIITDLYKGLEVITLLLKDITNSVKDDHATNKKIEEASETLVKISTQTSLERAQTHIKSSMSSLQVDTSSIKDMMTEMHNAFRGQSSLAPSSSVTLTFSLTDTPTNVEGENATYTSTKEPPSHTEGETDANIQETPENPKQSTDVNIEFIGSSTHPPLITQAQPITIIHPEPFVPQREGKDIATDDKAKDQRKLVKASSIVRPNLDEPVIKVVPKEAKKLGIHPKEVITTKAGELFKKGEHEVLKRQHTKKVKKSLELRKHKPFLFGAFGISELDELRQIFPKKKNIVVKNFMNSPSRRYERLRQIPRELGIQSALPAPEQAPSQTLERKQKHMELEPETSIPGLECNRALPENGMFIKNMVISFESFSMIMTVGPEASRALSKKSKRRKSKNPPIETMRTPPKPTKGSDQSHSVSSGAGQRLMGNKPPANMEPKNLIDDDLSGTGAKYQEDHTQSSRLRITEDQWEKHKEEVVHYVNLKASINDYYNENIAHRDQTGKLVEASMSSLKKSNTIINDLYKGLPILFSSLKQCTLTFSLTDTPINVEGENATHSATEEPHSHTEGETDANIQRTPKEPKQSTDANIEFIGASTNPPSITQDKRKLVKASSIVRPDPNEPVRVEFVINEKTFYLNEQEIQEYWDKAEEIKKAELEARLNAISTEVIKVVCKQAKKLGIHPKEAITTKVGELFRKAQDAEHEVFKRQHTKKKFDVHNPFFFEAFGISELNELREIILKKKNIMVKDLMNYLSRRYERLMQILRELGIQSALPAPEQATSQTSKRKQKHMELDPETRIPRWECNRALPKNGSFIKKHGHRRT
uniref:Uncharacterized protein n=1 Tax=Tanacetum cinerariifolium TaxID=118510 RepID=A0A6L2KX17_TANCI|nr:hypothetical protein [Tanacetum cinerariifolium]